MVRQKSWYLIVWCQKKQRVSENKLVMKEERQYKVEEEEERLFQFSKGESSVDSNELAHVEVVSSKL